MAGYTLPAPIGGLDLVSPIDNMDPTRALELVNIFPDSQAPRVRDGYGSGVSTGVGTQLNFLKSLPLTNGTTKLVGTDSTKIWEFSTGAAVDITGATVPSTSIWYGDTFAHRLYMCNGLNTPQVYIGTGTCSDITFTGPTLANLINVFSHKERIWFIEKNSMTAWYGNTQAVGGSALTSVNFQYVFKKGGYLLFGGSYTNQTAQTTDDLFFLVSSEGEVVFYTGSYPGDTTTPWGIVASSEIGKPLGFRSFFRVNNDIWVITYQGIYTLSLVFAADPEDSLNSVGLNINPAISDAAANIGMSHIWNGVHWPQGSRVLIILPTSGATSSLLVYSLETKAWTTYELYDSGACVCIARKDESIYYGSANGVVYQGESGGSDNGNAINFNARLPFSFFGNRGQYKVFNDLRPLMRGPGGLTLGLGIDTDFVRLPDLSTIITATGTFTPYGSPYGSLYSSGVMYLFDRYATSGQGHCGAIRIQGSIEDTSLEFYAFEVRFSPGGEV